MIETTIREERSADQKAIRSLTEEAFRGRPYADGDEQDVIDRLRKAGVLSLSLVSVLGNEVVGQITFSPAALEKNTGIWFALGPVAVLPAHQGQGIGSALINQGLTRIEDQGALGCILTGNPAYYQRFGFVVSPVNCPPNEPGEFFMLKLLSPVQPVGRFSFHPAFYGNA